MQLVVHAKWRVCARLCFVQGSNVCEALTSVFAGSVVSVLEHGVRAAASPLFLLLSSPNTIGVLFAEMHCKLAWGRNEKLKSLPKRLWLAKGDIWTHLMILIAIRMQTD